MTKQIVCHIAICVFASAFAVAYLITPGAASTFRLPLDGTVTIGGELPPQSPSPNGPYGPIEITVYAFPDLFYLPTYTPGDINTEASYNWGITLSVLDNNGNAVPEPATFNGETILFGQAANCSFSPGCGFVRYYDVSVADLFISDTVRTLQMSNAMVVFSNAPPNYELGLEVTLPDGLYVTPLPPAWTMMLMGLTSVGFLAYRGTKKRSAAISAA
jgi:hypothetical protein